MYGTGPVHVSAFLLAALSLLPGESRSQDSTTPGATPHTAMQPRNAFAETLSPKVKSGEGRKAGPYSPIRKQDEQADIPEIEMFVGESRVFPAPGVARIAVGNGQIMSAAALDGKEMILFANGVGTSSLFVWNEDGRYQRVKVNIVPGDTTRVAREVAAFLTTIPHARASIVGDKVIVEGDLLSDADLAKIELLEKRYPQIVNFTNRLGWEPMVLLDVKVVEFPLNELREIGLNWSAAGGAAIGGIWRPGRRGDDDSYRLHIQTGQGNPIPVISAGEGGAALPSSSLNVLSAANLGLNAQLNLLAQDGKAVILSEPQLAARSGAKASFLAGGEFPYSVATRDGITVQFKRYGVKLDIAPKVDRAGAVRATVDAEVSKIDASVSTPSGPALLSRNTRTEFNLRSGETMVLAGLIDRDNSTNVDKVPLLGDIPVLGALFRSKRFQNRETELVVFVTPRIVDTASPGQADRVERVNGRLEQHFGPRPFLSSPVQPGVDQGTGAAVPAAVGTVPNTSTLDHGRPDANERPALLQGGKTGIASPLPVSLSDPERRNGGPMGTTAAIPVAVSSPAPAVTEQAAASGPTATATPSHGGQRQLRTQDRRSDYLPRRAHAATSSGRLLQIQRDDVIVHADPDVHSPEVLRLGQGAVVQFGGASLGAGTWQQIAVGDVNGWVPASVVTDVQGSGVLQPAFPGEAAAVDTGGKRLQIGSGTGVPAGAPTPVTASAMQASRQDPAVRARRYRVLPHRLALRTAPDINAEVVDHLMAGQPVQSLGHAPKRRWIAVEADGKRGWVSSQWLKPDDGLEGRP
jgi:pilus assembly protein CpaC